MQKVKQYIKYCTRRLNLTKFYIIYLFGGEFLAHINGGEGGKGRMELIACD